MGGMILTDLRTLLSASMTLPCASLASLASSASLDHNQAATALTFAGEPEEPEQNSKLARVRHRIQSQGRLPWTPGARAAVIPEYTFDVSAP